MLVAGPKFPAHPRSIFEYIKNLNRQVSEWFCYLIIKSDFGDTRMTFAIISSFSVVFRDILMIHSGCVPLVIAFF